MKSYLLAVWYYLCNLFKKTPLVDAQAGYDLALTSHSDRVLRAFMAIESACERARPARVMLFLSKDDWAHQLPPSLERLHARGLEVIECENVGPHKKQQAYLDSHTSFHRPLLTIDDDVFYDVDLLERLFSAWKSRPSEIHCSRARRVSIQRGELLPYRTWPLCDQSHASYATFSTGVGGVIYPPGFLAHLKEAGKGFKELCPHADDVWVHRNAVALGFRVRQLSPTSTRFPDIPGSRRTALFRLNVRQGENDKQLKNSYSPDLIARIWASSNELH
jgi:hypothetical protein